ncbi:MAG: LPS export ABC transporter periplasmic protein LptC [Salinivirgaceae bacterium]|nr:LPS export ABC transporter periplasmic protein LptC [Salinivirgaceae bacterium]
MTNKIFFKMIPAMVGIIFFVSCKNDIEVVKRITSIETYPTMAAEHVSLYRSDSGQIVMKLDAASIKKFTNVENPYTEFSEGLEAQFFDENQEVSTYISANHVIYYEKEEKWVARYDVEVLDRDGRVINTEYMVFDQKKGKIYSDQFTKFTEEDAIIYGKGFESDPNLTNARILEPTGYFYVDNEEK